MVEYLLITWPWKPNYQIPIVTNGLHTENVSRLNLVSIFPLATVQTNIDSCFKGVGIPSFWTFLGIT